MKKLLLIVLIFLIMGAVSAHDDLNGTADPILKDMEYNSNIADDDLEVEVNNYIPVEVKSDDAWSLNVYIDRHASPINDELENVSDEQIDIPTTVMIDEEEVPLDLGKHNIIYEFKFTNTTSVYNPEVSFTDSGMCFDFKFIRSIKNPQNSIYRFNSKFTIVEGVDPIETTLNPADITMTYSDSLSFALKGINSCNVDVYLDGKFFTSLYVDENNFEEEIDTTKLAIGSYNLVMIVESDKVYGEYNIRADTSASAVKVNFAKSSTVHTPMRYIAIINTTLNVRDFPDLNIINVAAPSIDITRTKGIPIYFEGEEMGNLVAYIDGEKVYDAPIHLSWENALYIPTKDANGNYFDVGSHDLSFELVFQDKYSSFRPTIMHGNDGYIFDFSQSRDSSAFLNDKYVINAKMNIKDNAQFVPIDSDAVVKIVHTNDINIRTDGLPDSYDLTVYVDDNEIYDEHVTDNSIAVKTFFPRSSIEETNERDIQVGKHDIRFEFKALYDYDVDIEFKNNVLYFKFTPKNSNIHSDGVYYQFNTSLIVTEKSKTVHILDLKNNTYFDDTELAVKMDTYDPEDDDDDWDDSDEENPLGTQDVGIILSDENGIVCMWDDLINVYKHKKWNHDFENEKLPKAGIYTLKIINLADNTYDTAKFEVKKANRIFTKKYSSDDFNVLFTLDFSSCRGDLNEPFTITLDNQQKTINVKKSSSKNKREILFTDIDPGVYTATFTLKGNEIYKDAVLKSKITVKKEAPEINCQKSGSNKLDLTIDIPKSKTDAVLIVSAGGVEKKFTITKNTRHLTVEFDNLQSGDYDVEIAFKGNERYASKTLTVPLEITHHSAPAAPQPGENANQTSNDGVGNNTDGIGTGTGDSNVPGNGNGTYNGKISFNGKGFNGQLGSQGSGHGDGAKGYEINKLLKKIDDTPTSWLIFLIIAVALLFLSFIYERREDDDSEEY